MALSNAAYYFQGEITCLGCCCRNIVTLPLAQQGPALLHCQVCCIATAALGIAWNLLAHVGDRGKCTLNKPSLSACGHTILLARVHLSKGLCIRRQPSMRHVDARHMIGRYKMFRKRACVGIITGCLADY